MQTTPYMLIKNIFTCLLVLFCMFFVSYSYVLSIEEEMKAKIPIKNITSNQESDVKKEKMLHGYEYKKLSNWYKKIGYRGLSK